MTLFTVTVSASPVPTVAVPVIVGIVLATVAPVTVGTGVTISSSFVVSETVWLLLSVIVAVTL